MDDNCLACNEIKHHPCEYCGFGEIFYTHNDITHCEGGDEFVPDCMTEEIIPWTESIHVSLDDCCDHPNALVHDPDCLCSCHY